MAERKAVVVQSPGDDVVGGYNVQCRVSPAVGTMASKVASLRGITRGKLLTSILQPILEAMLAKEIDKLTPKPKRGGVKS